MALGSNLGDRRRNLARAVHALREVVSVVKVSAIHETAPVDAPPRSPMFLNMVVVGYTILSPQELLEALLEIEARLGRVRRGRRGEPRLIDLDLVAHGAHRRRSGTMTLPHPRAARRDFVMAPLRECSEPLARYVRRVS